MVGFHAAWSAPGVGVDEQVGVVFQGRLGEVDLACIVAIPGVVERSGWGCWARAKDRSLLCGLDEVSNDGQGADVLVEERLGDFLLVVVGETGGAELIAWLRGRVWLVIWFENVLALVIDRLTSDTESSRAASSDHSLMLVVTIDFDRHVGVNTSWFVGVRLRIGT